MTVWGSDFHPLSLSSPLLLFLFQALLAYLGVDWTSRCDLDLAPANTEQLADYTALKNTVKEAFLHALLMGSACCAVSRGRGSDLRIFLPLY